MIAKIACSFIGVLHLYFGYREIFGWRSFARKILGDKASEGFLHETAGMAANQGVYNWFIGLGLLLSVTGIFTNGSQSVALYLLACVIVAGIVGWKTMKVSVFLLAQSALALVAFIICWLYWPDSI